jgi:uncharacterized membrane protein (DUF2068 family)
MWVCSIRGHVTPAADVVRLRAEDADLGIELAGGERLARCLRCDAWIHTSGQEDGGARRGVLPPRSQLPRPRRGRELQDAIVLRVIAIERAIHGVLFTVLAIVLLLVRLDLGRIQRWAQSVRTDLTGTIANTGDAGHSRLASELARVAHLQNSTIDVLLITAVIYAVVESVEAVGLWRERRWAEYLTVLATAGFLPFEVRELLDRVTVFRVGALVVNLAVLVYLLWAKRLFGLRGGSAALAASYRAAEERAVRPVPPVVPQPGAS